MVDSAGAHHAGHDQHRHPEGPGGVHHAPHHLPGPRGGVEATLAGDHEAGPGEPVGKPHGLRHHTKAGHEPGADGRQPAGQPPGRACTGESGDVDAVALPQVHGPGGEAVPQLDDLGRCRPLLGPELLGGVYEPGLHVTGDDDLGRGQAAGGIDHLERAPAPVGRGRTTHSHQQPSGAGRGGGDQELTRAPGAGTNGVVALGAAGQGQPRGGRRFHHGDAVAHPPRGHHGRPQRTRHPGPAPRARRGARRGPPLGHDLGEALPAVGQRASVAVPSGPPGAPLHGRGQRRRDRSPLEGVGGGQHRGTGGGDVGHRAMVAGQGAPCRRRVGSSGYGTGRLPLKADLVIASNRGPLSFALDREDRPVPAGSAGGLAAALHPQLEGSGATWVSCAMSDADRKATTEGLMTERGLHLLTVQPDMDVYRMAYDVVSNSTLWFLHHHLFDLARRPRFDRHWARAWEAYREFNELFAAVVDAAAAEGATVLVQDYHLSLLPGVLAEKRPDLRTVHFTHTPFASPDTLRVLPSGVAREVLEGMAAATACAGSTRCVGRRASGPAARTWASIPVTPSCRR